MEFKLEDLLLKTTGQLNDDEKAFLVEHKEELDDEAKVAYADFLDTSSSSPEDTEGQDDSGEVGNENSENEDENGEGGTKKGTENENQQKEYSFQSEEEAKEFVKKQLAEAKKADEEAKQDAIDKAKTPEEKKYVEDNWMPKDWNEGIKTAVKIAKEEIKAEQEEQQKKSQEDAKRLQAEWEEISKTNNIPAISTKEGREIHDQVVKLAIENGKTNFNDGYKLWAQTPKEFGGGYDPVKVAESLRQKKDADARRKAASKIGDQNPGAGSVKGSGSIKPITYEEIHGKGRNKIVKEALNG